MFLLTFVLPVGFNLDSDASEYNAYLFYHLLEQMTDNCGGSNAGVGGGGGRLVEDVKISPNLALIIKSLWTDSGVQLAYDRRHTFALPDCAAYFLENIDRISDPKYLPTTKDILNTRERTHAWTPIPH